MITSEEVTHFESVRFYDVFVVIDLSKRVDEMAYQCDVLYSYVYYMTWLSVSYMGALVSERFAQLSTSYDYVQLSAVSISTSGDRLYFKYSHYTAISFFRMRYFRVDHYFCGKFYRKASVARPVTVY